MNSFRKIAWENTKAVFLAVILALIIKTSVVEAYKVPTGSMEDTILIGDFIVGNKFIYGARIPLLGWRLPAINEPQSGDVVVFKVPFASDTNYVKRCLAGPGQVIEIKDKIVYVDGAKIPLPETGKFLRRTIPRPVSGGNTPDNFGPYRVPEDYYFMMGDNRDNSFDSRFWGPVHEDYILGKAMFVLWSWADDDNAPEVAIDQPLSPPRLFIYNAVNFYERFRWERMVKDID